MKKQKVTKYVNFIALTILVGIAAFACTPAFFVSTSAESPLEVGPGPQYISGSHGDFTSKYMINGIMNQGAQKPEDLFCLNLDIGGTGDRDLLVWDGSDWLNVTDGTEAADALDAIADNEYVTFKPAVDYSMAYMSWVYYNTKTPQLCISVEDIENTTGYDQTIYTAFVHPTDEYGHSIWRVNGGANNWYMSDEKQFHFRAGDNSDDAEPEITGLNFTCDPDVAYRVSTTFSPQVTFNEKMGVLYALLWDVTNSTPIPLTNSAVSESSGNYTYTFSLGTDFSLTNIELDYNSQYQLVIFDKNGDDLTIDEDNFGLIPPDVALSQDLSGNPIDQGAYMDDGDMSDLIGGDDVGIDLLYQCFYTETAP